VTVVAAAGYTVAVVAATLMYQSSGQPAPERRHGTVRASSDPLPSITTVPFAQVAITTEAEAARYVRAYNETQVRMGDIAITDGPPGLWRRGDNVVVGDFADQPRPLPPEGYRRVYYTHGCATCPVGWVLKKGTACLPSELTCEN
jgi:hypothetical protein